MKITTEEIRQARNEFMTEERLPIDSEQIAKLAMITVVNVAISLNPAEEIAASLQVAMEVGYYIGRKQMLAELTKVQE